MKIKLNKKEEDKQGERDSQRDKERRMESRKEESGKRLGSKMCSDRLVSSCCKYHFQNKVVRKRGRHAKPKMLTLKEDVKHNQK
jgi:hypothetical protein